MSLIFEPNLFWTKMHRGRKRPFGSNHTGSNTSFCSELSSGLPSHLKWQPTLFRNLQGFTRAALPLSWQNLLPLVLTPAHYAPPQQCLNYSQNVIRQPRACEVLHLLWLEHLAPHINKPTVFPLSGFHKITPSQTGFFQPPILKVHF